MEIFLNEMGKEPRSYCLLILKLDSVEYMIQSGSPALNDPRH